MGLDRWDGQYNSIKIYALFIKWYSDGESVSGDVRSSFKWYRAPRLYTSRLDFILFYLFSYFWGVEGRGGGAEARWVAGFQGPWF